MDFLKQDIEVPEFKTKKKSSGFKRKPIIALLLIVFTIFIRGFAAIIIDIINLINK